MLSSLAMKKMTPAELEMVADLSELQGVGDQIRRAGFPCKHVYRFWTQLESDIRFKGEPIAFAVFLSMTDEPQTACFAEDAVLVSQGW